VRDGKVSYGLWKRYDFLDENKLNEDEILTINIDQSTAGRPDVIAEEYYESPLLEWVVVMFNRPQDPINWPVAGSVIRIPTRGAVLRGI
jgi:hypothetical protein